MKTLKEYNDITFNNAVDYQSYNKKTKNGIKCECGEELWDSNPGIILTSLPPQKNVHCDGCGFKGYRYA
jgi:hypothetical protein